jgi:hypothetical protein
MIIMGVDFHPEFQQIASVDTDTGEFQEERRKGGHGAQTRGSPVPDAAPGIRESRGRRSSRKS